MTLLTNPRTRDAFDLSKESDATKKLYGADNAVTKDYGERCLIARRLIERGVRFVQIYTGNQTWDHHNGIVKSLPDVCRRTDRPSAALVRDLKQRGLLDTTLVHWGGEMGRLPVIQNEKNIGRDHNTYGFSMWLAGGGIKPGFSYGESDDFAYNVARDPVEALHWLLRGQAGGAGELAAGFLREARAHTKLSERAEAERRAEQPLP